MEVSFYRTSSGRNVIDEYVSRLPARDQARFIDVHKGLKERGLGCPRVTFRQLAGKLWEIKYAAPGGGFRIAYVMVQSNRMVMLHIFKKTTRKTPKTDLDLGLRRMKEVMAP